MRRTVTREGGQLDLSVKEFGVLATDSGTFASRPGRAENGRMPFHSTVTERPDA